jgi:WD40 repeat protein
VLEATAGPEETLALSHLGQDAALGSGWGSIKLIDLSSGKVLPSPPNHEDWVCSVAFSPDGKCWSPPAGGYARPGWETNQRGAEAVGCGRTKHLPAHQSTTRSCRGLRTGWKDAGHEGFDRTSGLWDVATWKAGQARRAYRCRTLRPFSPDSRILASAGADRHSSSGMRRRAKLAGHAPDTKRPFSPWPSEMARRSPPAALTAFQSARDLEKHEHRVILRGHQGAVYSLAFLPMATPSPAEAATRPSSCGIWPAQRNE